MEYFHGFIRYIYVQLPVFLTLLSNIKGKDVLYNLTENMPPNTYLGNVAEDAGLIHGGSAINDTIKYGFLTGDNPYVALFNINSRESSLYTSRKLDREILCEYKSVCLFDLEVIAQCLSGSCYDKIIVKVELIDINDNFPTFPNSVMTLNFSEGSIIGTSIPIPGAIDRDNGNFSVQKYSVQQDFPPIKNTSDPYFSVHSEENIDTSFIYIVLEKKLDRETNDHYRIRIIATDGGMPPKSGSVEVIVTITDINEFAPVFKESIYNVSVNEDISSNTSIVNVSAFDPDQGVNAKITYKLSPNQDIRILTLFNINETTGEIKVNGSLIYEPGESYKIKVWASDQATTPLIGQAQVFVYVKDVHNNAPQISVNLLSNTGLAEISEHASLGAAVAHIKVNDPDHGSNGEVNCSVISDKFKLQKFNEEHEFKVVVAETLNREVSGKHQVTVVCSDNGTPPKNSSTSFVVTVLDINDNVPIFSKNPYLVYIEENNPIGKSLLTVSAVDFDSGINADISFYLNDTQGLNLKIDPSTGVITSYVSFDRENKSLASFLVFAKDGGSPPETGSATVTIHVTDQNDNSPVFTEDNYVFSVLENMARNVSIGFLFADDDDFGENKTITFSILPQYNGGIPFFVLPNGQIKSSEMLDREAISKYDFSVIASDQGNPPLKSSAHVTVNVLDTNDNDPEFLFPNSMNNTVVISFQTPTEIVFTKIEAKDPDGSKLFYSFRDENVSHLFTLNGVTGEIMLRNKLSTSDAKRYTFGVVIKDSGTPPRMSERAMTIVVTSRGIDGSMVAQTTSTNTQYFLIAVAIACVTFVLAVIILTAIFLVRRFDKKPPYCDKEDDDYHPKQGREFEMQKKTVSFSLKKSHPGSNPTKEVKADINKNSQYYDGLGSFQVSEAGSPVTSDTRQPEVPNARQQEVDIQRHIGFSNTSPQNIRQVLHLQEIPSTSKVTKAPILSGILKRPQHIQDDHRSDTSDETPSDSGKGGSEIDLNSSVVFTYPTEPDCAKSNPASQRRSVQQQQLANRYRIKPQTSHTHRENQNRQNIPGVHKTISPSSIILKTYGHNTKPPPLFIKKTIMLGQTGNASISNGHDSSTTTSGSYTLDHDADKYLEVRQLSKQSVL